MENKTGKLFVVSGPSGAGKTSVVAVALRRLQKEYDLSRIVTYTSRPPRENEVSGQDYIFVSGDEFHQKQKDGFFLETNVYNGRNYGSPWPEESELTQGKSYVLIVDIEGAKSVSKEFRDAIMIWIAPPDMTTLKKRLEKRATESVSQIEKRLTQAEEEMKEAHKIRLFGYVLVNDIFDQAVEELILLVRKALSE
ncbi:guanylate kinase [Candidatus Dependentiae bacterium]|nr:guanylate kinase [Candidatus Dependentiae bacterium]